MVEGIVVVVQCCDCIMLNVCVKEEERKRRKD